MLGKSNYIRMAPWKAGHATLVNVIVGVAKQGKPFGDLVLFRQSTLCAQTDGRDRRQLFRVSDYDQPLAAIDQWQEAGERTLCGLVDDEQIEQTRLEREGLARQRSGYPDRLTAQYMLEQCNAIVSDFAATSRQCATSG